MSQRFPPKRQKHNEDDTEDLPEEHEHNDEDSDDPVESILGVIQRYYKGLKREKEGMGAE